MYKFLPVFVDTVQRGLDAEKDGSSTVPGGTQRYKPRVSEGRRHTTDRVDSVVVAFLAAKPSHVPAGDAVAFLARAGSQQCSDRSDGC